jgi:predicted PurR-regulated permease PerM
MVVLLFLVAVALAIAIEPAVTKLSALGLSRQVAILLIYLILLALIALLMATVLPMLAEQSANIASSLPETYQNFRNQLLGSRSMLLRMLGDLLPSQLGLQSPSPLAASEPINPITPLWQFAKSTLYVFFSLTVISILAYLWALNREVMLRKLLLRAPSARREELRELITEIEDSIGSYFRGQTILCLIVGVMSTAIYLLAGIPYALVLGLIMTIFELIPIIGPTLGAVPAVLITLATAPDKVVWVILGLVLVQALENNLLVPRIMDKTVGVNAVASILAIAAFGILFGLPGAILAIPLAAIVQILLKRTLFHQPPSEELIEPVTPTEVVARDSISVLRLEAQKLAQDARKQARQENGVEESATPEVAQAEDMIESIALNLDTWLIKAEMVQTELVHTEAA